MTEALLKLTTSGYGRERAYLSIQEYLPEHNVPFAKSRTYQENEFYNQPYKVVKREKQIIVAEYVAVED